MSWPGPASWRRRGAEQGSREPICTSCNACDMKWGRPLVTVHSLCLTDPDQFSDLVAAAGLTSLERRPVQQPAATGAAPGSRRGPARGAAAGLGPRAVVHAYWLSTLQSRHHRPGRLRRVLGGKAPETSSSPVASPSGGLGV